MRFAFPALHNFAAACLASLPLAAGAQTFQISIETTPIAGEPGFLAFDLLKGDGGIVNDVIVSSFSTSSVLGVGSAVGDVTGGLLSSLTLRSSGFFNEYLQPIVFAVGVTTFQVSMTNNYLDGNIPDSFAIFLLDDSLIPYATSDPTGSDALVVFDLATSVVPQTFTSDHAVATVVPEPGAAALMLAGLAVLAGALRGAAPSATKGGGYNTRPPLRQYATSGPSNTAP